MAYFLYVDGTKTDGTRWRGGRLISLQAGNLSQAQNESNNLLLGRYNSQTGRYVDSLLEEYEMVTAMILTDADTLDAEDLRETRVADRATRAYERARKSRYNQYLELQNEFFLKLYPDEPLPSNAAIFTHVLKMNITAGAPPATSASVLSHTIALAP